MRTYQLILQHPSQGVLNQISFDGENALDAFERAIDAGALNVPPSFAGRVVAIRMDNICMTFELGFAG